MVIYHRIKIVLSNFIILAFFSYEAMAQEIDPCSEIHISELSESPACVLEGLSDPNKKQQCGRRLLEKQCNAFKTATSISEPLQEQIKILEARINELEIEIDAKSQELGQFQQKILVQENINDEQKEENVSLTQTLADLETRNQALELEIERLGKTVFKDLDNEITQTKEEVNEEVQLGDDLQTTKNIPENLAQNNPGGDNAGAVFTPPPTPLRPLVFGRVKHRESPTLGLYFSATTPDILSLISIDLENGLGKIKKTNGILWLNLQKGKQTTLGSFTSEGIDNDALQLIMAFIESFPFPPLESSIELVIFFGTQDEDYLECRGISELYYKVSSTRLLSYCLSLSGKPVRVASPLNYPHEARLKEIEDEITLAFDIGISGATENIRIITPDNNSPRERRTSIIDVNYYFDDEAIKYVAGLRYKPFSRNGIGVLFPDAIIRLSFRLED